MQLRNDFKFALVEEYKTYWNAYDNKNEFYSNQGRNKIKKFYKNISII